MKIPHLQYDEDYYGPLSASVDWVAGGNFDGYVYQQRLRFSEKDQKVTLFYDIIDASRYDSKVDAGSVEGHYQATDHETITCSIGETTLRGVLLGPNKSIIAFSRRQVGVDRLDDVCYALQKSIFG